MTNEQLAICLSQLLNERRGDYQNSYNTMACGERIVYYEPANENIFWLSVSSIKSLVDNIDGINIEQLTEFFEQSREEYFEDENDLPANDMKGNG